MIERYTLPRMGALWTDSARYERWLAVELAVCEVLHEDGAIPPDAIAGIRARAGFDAGEIDAIERETRHDVIAFLTCVQRRVGEAGRYIHRGLTSSDVVDTALSLAMVRGLALVGEGLARLERLVAELAWRHRRTAMIGRTHGVHAEPTTFGMKLAVWLGSIGRGRERLSGALERIRAGKLSGAVGLYATLSPEVERRVLLRLGLVPPIAATQVLQRDRHAEVLQALALLSSSLEQFAIELRHLARTEVREVEEPFAEGQKGSSAMPHKRNPVLCERVTGLARVLRANASAALENVALWHERDISHSSVERIVIPDSFIAIDYQLDTFCSVLEGLRVFPERMLANLESTGGLIFSGRVLTALTEAGLAREEAYRTVQTHAMAAWDESPPGFRTRLEQDDGIAGRLGPDRLADCFEIESTLARADALVERATTALRGDR